MEYHRRKTKGFSSTRSALGFKIGAAENIGYRLVTTLLTSIIFSFIPGIFSVFFYIRIAGTLLRCKKKVGRNLNLILAFGFSCFTWLICWAVYCGTQIQFFFIMKNKQVHKLYTFAIISNLAVFHLINLISGLTSILNPFLLLIILQNYRKPAVNFFKRLKATLSRKGG